MDIEIETAFNKVNRQFLIKIVQQEILESLPKFERTIQIGE